MSGLEVAKVMDSLSFSDPRRVPALPLRPSRLAEQGMSRGVNFFDSAKTLADTWNAWTDCVQKVFQQMCDQLEHLEVSDDDYIGFVRLFASHSARPTLQPLRDDLMSTMPHRYLTHVHDLWTAYADRLEKTYDSMTAELGRCDLLSSAFEIASTRGQLHGILRSMLGPGRLFQGVVDTRRHEAMAVEKTSRQRPSIVHMDEVVLGIEQMKLCGEQAIHVEIGDGLVLLLKKLSMEEGIS